VIKNIGAIRTGVFISLVPVFGTTASILILNETLYWTFIAGLILIVSGILFINPPIFTEDEDSS
jgi:drug/metabolite transporter (DMT)-like permease